MTIHNSYLERSKNERKSLKTKHPMLAQSLNSMRNPTHRIIVEGERRTKIKNGTWKYKYLGLKNYLIGSTILEDGFLWVEGGGVGEEIQ